MAHIEFVELAEGNLYDAICVCNASIDRTCDFKLKLYSHEQSMSVGPRTWPIVKGALAELL